jgi:SAM-dependent methyltransferase
MRWSYRYGNRHNQTNGEIMPSSTFSAISPIMEAVQMIKPTSVLDVGCGYGKYGFLCREYIEIWKKVEAIIDAIEVFGPYIEETKERGIYDHIFQGEAITLLKLMPDKIYDLILAIDILEHFDEKDGNEFLDEIKRIGKSAIICTPTTMRPQGAEYGNIYETHRKQWSASEICQKLTGMVWIEPGFTIVMWRRDK